MSTRCDVETKKIMKVETVCVDRKYVTVPIQHTVFVTRRYDMSMSVLCQMSAMIAMMGRGENRGEGGIRYVSIKPLI